MYYPDLQYTFPHFSVLQWNQLNSSLSTPSSFPKIDPKLLDWELRSPLIEEALNKNLASIICLEEVDQIEFYSKFFEEKKYKFIYDQKNGGTSDYILIAYNPKILSLEYSETIRYYDPNTKEKHSQFALSASFNLLLNGQKTEQELILYATHLKAKNFEDTRKIQISQLLENIKKKKSSLSEKEKSKTGFIVCGDFNAEPHFDCVQMMEKEGDFNSFSKNFNFTTYKIREKEYCRIIDYIFFSSSLKLICRNTNVSKEEIGINGLPNEKFPSDHLQLYAVFGVEK